MRFFFIRLITITFALTGVAAAQTVTVSKSGTADFTTVQAAINSFNANPNPAPNLVQITDSAVYEEAIANSEVSLTIEGTGAGRPILVVRPQASGGSTAGINISFSLPPSQPFTLRNLIIIPSLTAPPATAVRATGISTTVELDNVLITANNGSNGPVSLDGLTLADITGAVFFSQNGVYMDGTYFTGILRNTVITHLLGNPNVNSQHGLQVGGGYYTDCKILDGCVFSFCSRMGIYGGGGNFDIDAPTTRCVIANNRGFAGLWFSNGRRRSINGAIIANNSGFGFEHQNANSLPLTVSNSIIANNGNTNFKVSEVGTSGDIRLTSVTIASSSNPAAPAIEVASQSSAKIYLTDCIIGGNGSGDSRNTVLHNGTGVMSLSGTALVTQGPFAMSAAMGGSGTFSGASTATADPRFVDSTDPASADYFDVTNTAYGTANTIGGPLGGGADFVIASGVSDWSVY